MSLNTSAAPSLSPPRTQQGVLGWIRASLFSSPLNSILTILVAWLLLMAIPAMIEWLFIRANFNATNAQECRASGGACWAFIVEKHRLILFGVYPYDEQWRPLLASIILVSVIVCSCIRWFWRPFLGIIWAVGLVAVAVLM